MRVNAVMPVTIAVVLVWFFLALGPAMAESKPASVPKQIHRLDLEITGASCGLCYPQILKALQSAPGVVGADLERGRPLRASVLFDSTKTNVEALKTILRRKGYGVARFQEIVDSQLVSTRYKQRLNALSDVKELQPLKPKMP
jgi:copper chaperone CopZ